MVATSKRNAQIGQPSDNVNAMAHMVNIVINTLCMLVTGFVTTHAIPFRFYDEISIRLSTAIAFRGMESISSLSLRAPPLTSFRKILSELLSSVNRL